MSQRPVAVAVNTEVGTVGPAIVVVLLAVEIWPSRIVLHWGARQNPVTDTLDAQHQAGFDAWAASAATSRPPEDPAHVLYQELHVGLQDEAGTEFRCMAGQAGGQYTEWSCTHVYQPAPTGTLTLLIESAAGRRTVRIPAT